MINKHLSKCLQYNVPNGKKNRGLAVPATFKQMKPDCTEEELKEAYILGWCVEFVSTEWSRCICVNFKDFISRFSFRLFSW